MIKRYAKGRGIEYLAKKQLLDERYYVIRSAGSKGLWDLVAVGYDGIKFIQVKTKKPNPSEIEELKNWIKSLSKAVYDSPSISFEIWIKKEREKDFDIILLKVE